MAIEEQVFRLQISINDVLGVQILKRQSNLCSVEFGDRVWETLRVGKLLAQYQ